MRKLMRRTLASSIIMVTLLGAPLYAQDPGYVQFSETSVLAGVDSVTLQVRFSWEGTPPIDEEQLQQEMTDVLELVVRNLGITVGIDDDTYVPSLRCNVTASSSGRVVGVTVHVSLLEWLWRPDLETIQGALTWQGVTTMTISPETVGGALFGVICGERFQRDWQAAHAER